MAKGILIDTEWCSGCHSCEMACQMHNHLPVGQTGVIVQEIGPWQISDNDWQLSYLPAFTKQCYGCAKRVAEGKLPTCVQHCQARCLEYGDVEELTAKMGAGTKKVLCVI